MNWDEWTTGDLEQAQEDIAEVLRRRQLLATAAAQADTLARSVLAAEGHREGDPWRAPTGPHDAYPAGWTVAYGGVTYRSQIAGNMHEPALARAAGGAGGTTPWQVIKTAATDGRTGR